MSLRRARSDLTIKPLQAIRPSDWKDPEVVIANLYESSEAQATAAANWYAADKRSKRTASLLLRATSIVLGAAGGILPLIALSVPESAWSSLGYVLIATSAACLAFDRFFGLSTAWMRDTLGMLAIQRRTLSFHHEWSSILASPDVLTSNGIQRRLSLLAAFTTDIHRIVAEETGAWEDEFRLSIANLSESADSKVTQ